MADLHVIEPQRPDQSVVEYLEHLLKRAKNGEFSMIAAAYAYRDGTTGHGHSNFHSNAAMAGAVSCLLFDINEAMRHG